MKVGYNPNFRIEVSNSADGHRNPGDRNRDKNRSKCLTVMAYFCWSIPEDQTCDAGTIVSIAKIGSCR